MPLRNYSDRCTENSQSKKILKVTRGRALRESADVAFFGNGHVCRWLRAGGRHKVTRPGQIARDAWERPCVI